MAVVFDEAHLYFEREVLPIVQKIVAYLRSFNENVWFVVSSATLANKTLIPKAFNTKAIQGVLELTALTSNEILISCPIVAP